MADKMLEKQLTYVRSVMAELDVDGKGLAKLARCSPSTINRPLNSKNWPHNLSLKTLMKIAAVIRKPLPADLVSPNSPIMGDDTRPIRVHPVRDKKEAWPNEVTRDGAPEIPPIASMALDIDVRGTGECGDETADFELNGQIVDRVRRPPALTGAKDVFAIYLRGTSMEDRYRPGDLVFIHPGRPVIQGCDVLVELWAVNGDETACPALVKVFISRSSEKLVLEQLKPHKKITIPAHRIKNVFRILTPRELFGV